MGTSCRRGRAKRSVPTAPARVGGDLIRRSPIDPPLVDSQRPGSRAIRRWSLAPAAAAVGLATWLVSRDGGYDGSDWNLVGLAVVILLAASVILPGAQGTVAARRVLIAYGAFCAWSYLSIAWAQVPDAAWAAGNRAALYGLVLALVTRRRWGQRECVTALALAAICIAGLDLFTLLHPASVAGTFLGGRLAAPAGYVNATAELWLIALWPALGLACDAPLRTLGRPLWMAVATLLLQTSLLSQSRGSVLAIAFVAVFFVALGPARVKAAWALVTVIGACAVAWRSLSTLASAHDTAQLAAAFSHARLAIGLSCIGVALLTLAGDAAAGYISRHSRVQRLPWSRGRARRIARPITIAIAIAAFAVAAGDPVAWTQARWRDFKTSGYSRVDSATLRLAGGLGSNRYDFYRVALDEWVDHPVVGIGADNFRLPYLARRRSPEAPRFPHSLPIAVLSQLGLVGAALFAGFLGLLGAGLARGRRSGAPIAVAAGLGFLSWLVHSSVDWLWEFPGLGVFAFALAAIALQAGGGEALGPRRFAQPLLVGASLLGAVALALSFGIQRATHAAIDAGQRAAASHPHAAIANLEHAASLDRFESDSLVSEGIIASRIGEPQTALTALRRAIVRVPSDWFAHFELGLVEAASGDRSGGLGQLRVARALNPRQATIGVTIASIESGRTVDLGRIESDLTAPLARRLVPTGG